MRDDEFNQRSGFQFEIIKLNLIANGALVSVALTNPEEWSNATIACPLISFVLFSLWFHHALAIRIHSEKESRAQYYGEKAMLRALRKISFSASMFGNFVLIPFGAVILFELKQHAWLIYVTG